MSQKDILVFSNKQNLYRVFEPSALTDADALKEIEFEADEEKIFMMRSADYTGFLLTIYENGKAAKIPLASFKTKTKRKCQKNAYSNKSKLVYIGHIEEDIDLVAISSIEKVLLFNTAGISVQKTPSASGVQVMNPKAGSYLQSIKTTDELAFADVEFYRKKTPAVGYFLKEGDSLAQASANF